MDMQGIVDLSRQLSYKTIEQVPDTILLKYSNINYKQLVRKIITEVDENFFYDVKMLWIECKYKADDKFTKLSANTLWSLQNSLVWYEDYQSTENPFYRIGENSVFIYPKPTEDVTGWLKLYGIKNAIELWISAAETDFIISKEYLHIIAYWNMKQNYYNEMNQMIKELEERNLSVEEIILPNLTELE